MAKMTLWQHLMTKNERAAQERAFQEQTNPFGLAKGQFLQFDVIDYRGIDFQVDRVLSYRRKLSGRYHYFADYALVVPSGEKEVRLRAVGKDGPYLLLHVFDSFAFAEDFQGVIEECAKKHQFQIDDENALFFRDDGIDDPFSACVTDITAQALANDPGEEVTYWDFARETKDEAGFAMNEHFFVERREKDGWFTLLRGIEVSPNQVTIL